MQSHNIFVDREKNRKTQTFLRMSMCKNTKKSLESSARKERQDPLNRTKKII